MDKAHRPFHHATDKFRIGIKVYPIHVDTYSKLVSARDYAWHYIMLMSSLWVIANINTSLQDEKAGLNRIPVVR